MDMGLPPGAKRLWPLFPNPRRTRPFTRVPGRFTLLLGALALSPVFASAAEISAGCGLRPPTEALTKVTVRGEWRSVVVAVPESYRPDTPHDLVIAFHGRTNPAERVRGYYMLESHARRPTLFVYPRGKPAGGGARNWANPGDPAGQLRDYALFDALVEAMFQRYCVDRGRIFAVGHSLGASFVNSLGCARGGVLRGIATVAGGVSPSPCQGPTGALLVHHPEDRLVELGHGLRALRLFQDTNGVAVRPAPLSRLSSPPGFECERYGDYAAHPVVWCRHSVSHDRRGRYYPHQWPPETGRFIMDFFAALE